MVPQPQTGGRSRTLIHVVIRPQRARDRRQRDALERARQLLVSLKAYLVAQEFDMLQGAAQADDPQKGRGANV
jgi:hypothetical protein